MVQEPELTQERVFGEPRAPDVVCLGRPSAEHAVLLGEVPRLRDDDGAPNAAVVGLQAPAASLARTMPLRLSDWP